jgi:hypothetical protein
LNAIVTGSWAISFGYVRIVSGVVRPVTAAKADVVCRALVACAWIGCSSERSPLIRCPVAVALGS